MSFPGLKCNFDPKAESTSIWIALIASLVANCSNSNTFWQILASLIYFPLSIWALQAFPSSRFPADPQFQRSAISDIPHADRQFHQDSIITNFLIQGLSHLPISVRSLDLATYDELPHGSNTHIL
jgi:hypothetical protein